MVMCLMSDGPKSFYLQDSKLVVNIFEGNFNISGIDINDELTIGKILENRYYFRFQKMLIIKVVSQIYYFLEYFISKNIERVFHKEIKICQIPCAFSQHIIFVFSCSI